MSTVFEVTKLRKNFGGLAVTNDVSLNMVKGDRVALIGPNGAGKTTFVNLVTGNLAATSGTVALDGENVSRLNAMQRVRRGLVRSFQVTRLFFDMTPEEHVALAVLQREGKTGRILGNYRKMPEVMDEVRDILDALGLLHLGQLRVSEIAYGQQRLLEIALALALRPRHGPHRGSARPTTGRSGSTHDRARYGPRFSLRKTRSRAGCRNCNF
jgi:branched-chain amino acid transport system ATP-binding protein